MFSLDDICKGILGGIAIGLGSIGYVSCDNRVAGAFIFSLGLLVILSFKWKLFTGSICRKIAWSYRGRSFRKEVMLKLLETYISNFIGIMIMVAVYAIRSWDNLEGVQIIAARKLESGHLSRIFGGIICEICIFIAVYGFNTIKNDLRKSLIVVMSVMAFVLIGGEHCIADMFYMSFSGRFFAPIIFILEVTLGNVLGAAGIKVLQSRSE